MDLPARLRQKPAAFRQFTGLTVAAFDQLRADLEPVQAARKAKAQARRPHHRKPGAGRKPKLGSDDRLLVVLMYYRIYVTRAVLGGRFGVAAGTACRAIRAVGLALTGVFRIPERKGEPGADGLAAAFVDATERPTGRPGGSSGTTPGRSGTRPSTRWWCGRSSGRAAAAAAEGADRGRVGGGPRATHDQKVYDRSRVELPAGVPGAGDTAYLGTGLRVPMRKPRGRPLPRRQTAGNRRLARDRVVAGHGVGKMTVWRIAADRDRNPRSRHTVMMKNVAGRHNRMFGWRATPPTAERRAPPRSYCATSLLVVGDRLLTEDGRWVAVEDLLDTGEWETGNRVRPGGDE